MPGPEFPGGVVTTTFLNQLSQGLITDVDRQIFTAGGTWTKPSTAKLVYVQAVGGGGGGGGAQSTGSTTAACGGGGGGGEYGEGWFDPTTLGQTETVTVGAAGAASSAGAGAGGGGGVSSFGGWLIARGGSGGSGMAASVTIVSGGGAGGTAGSGGDFHLPGSAGDVGRVVGGVPVCVARGGASFMGQGAAQATASNTANGMTGTVYGGGGGGALNQGTGGTGATAGGAGAAGLVIVTTLY